MANKINVKNFFPNVPDEQFDTIKEVLMEVGTKDMVFLQSEIERNKNKFPKTWEKSQYKIISQKGANNIKKMTQSATEETACGFAMVKQEDQFIVFETFVEMFGAKQGAKKFQEHIDEKRKEFEYIKEKFPNTREIKEKY